MTSSRTVLIGLRRQVADEGAVRRDLEGWVEAHGFDPRFTADPAEALTWAREEPLAASFVDAKWEFAQGQLIWHMLQPVVGRRLVLMTRSGRTKPQDSAIWFEALRSGVAAVLPLPAKASTVHAALRAAARDVDSPGGFSDRWRQR